MARLDTMWGRAQHYYDQRGLDTSSWTRNPSGDKMQEEVNELRDALAACYAEPSVENARAVIHEIGDVAITLAWIAECFNISIESCIEKKTIKDAGRGNGPHYMAGR